MNIINPNLRIITKTPRVRIIWGFPIGTQVILTGSIGRNHFSAYGAKKPHVEGYVRKDRIGLPNIPLQIKWSGVCSVSRMPFDQGTRVTLLEAVPFAKSVLVQVEETQVVISTSWDNLEIAWTGLNPAESLAV